MRVPLCCSNGHLRRNWQPSQTPMPLSHLGLAPLQPQTPCKACLTACSSELDPSARSLSSECREAMTAADAFAIATIEGLAQAMRHAKSR